ncbi:MAG: type III PLP-dependent enzyme [Pseudomonadota bacterium]
MSRHERFYSDPCRYLDVVRPDTPVLFFSASKLENQHQFFNNHFPGLVSFAVKAQPGREVIETLVSGGMHTFDVASPVEMALVRSVDPQAVLHYNNPIRSQAEITEALRHGVASYAVDRIGELEKLLARLTAPVEIAVRLKLPTKGGKIDFGSKFGADEATTVALVKRVSQTNHKISMCFHPGTQCLDAQAWRIYIKACATLARQAGVTLARLNVGGGFPSQRTHDAVDLRGFFAVIEAEVVNSFGDHPPALLCEPGRAMVAEAFCLAARVKAVCSNQIFLNDGIYGGLSEMRDIGISTRIRLHASNPAKKTKPYIIFGPTCDSLDVLPDPITLPVNVKEGDYILFEAMGAYSTAIATRFNGYGEIKQINLSA